MTGVQTCALPILEEKNSKDDETEILRKIAKNDIKNIGDTSTLADPSVINDLIEGAN